MAFSKRTLNVCTVCLLVLLGNYRMGAEGGSVSPESLCVCPGDEATFTCSVEGSGGVFAWITNTTTETCQVFPSSPQSQCGQFIGQLQNSSLSTLTATSAATSDTGNIFIQCNHIVDFIGNATLLIAGIPPHTPILQNVTSGDIQDNGDGDTRNVTLRWTLSEPDDCLNTIHFNVTPDDPTHCGSCEVGRGDPGMQEEFSCQVMQGIGQACTYRVHAVRCGDTQSGVMSEPVQVVLTGSLLPTLIPSSTLPPPPMASSTPLPPPVASSTPLPPPVASSSTLPSPVASSTPLPPVVTSSTSLPPPVVSSTPLPPPMTSSTSLPPPVASSTPLPPVVTSSTPLPPPMTSSTSLPPPVASSTPLPPVVTSSTPLPPPMTSSTSLPPPVASSTPLPPVVTSSTSLPPPVASSPPHPSAVTSSRSSLLMYTVPSTSLHPSIQLQPSVTPPTSQEVPGPPVDVLIFNFGARWVALRWQPGFNGNRPTLSFIIQQLDLTEINSTYVEVIQEAVGDLVMVNGGFYEYIISDILPFTNYQFRVQACNKLGCGGFATSMSVVTEQDVPDGSPQNVEGIALNESSLRVTWEPPLPDVVNGIVTEYELAYTDNPELQMTEWERMTLPGNTTLTTITGLQENISYWIAVAASTSAPGLGPFSDPIQLQTQVTTKALFQLRLKEIGDCVIWVADNKEKKTLDIVTGVVELAETTCSCMFDGDNIVNREFSCRSDENTVVFRGEIVYTSDGESTAGSLVVFISQWVQDGASIVVDGVRLDVDSMCPAELESFSSEDCETMEETTGGGQESDTSVGVIVGSVLGGVCLLLVILVIGMVIVLWWRKHKTYILRGDGVELSQYPTDDTGTTVEFNQAYGQFKPSDHHFIPQSVPGAVLYENNGALPSESDYEAIDDHSYVVPHL